MKIFVTGFHRAGSHTISKLLARENNLPWIEEHNVDLWDFRRVIALTNSAPNGFVLQCPFLAHKVKELIWYGNKVYWADRNKKHVIKSMDKGDFKGTALIIIKQFYDEFPDDPYWNTPTFDDEDIKKYLLLKEGDKYPQLETKKWIKYYKLMVDVKEYFLETRFKDFVEVIRLEDLPEYNKLKGKKPLKGWGHD